jgi:hypothetical protein
VAAPRFEVRQWTPPAGWGLFATVGGRSKDLSDRSDWAQDPSAQAGEAAAGLGWHGPNASAVVGYDRPNNGAPADLYPHSPQPQGLLGFSLAYHMR